MSNDQETLHLKVREGKSQEGLGDGVESDTGLICLVMLSRIHGVTADSEHPAHQYSKNAKFLDGFPLVSRFELVLSDLLTYVFAHTFHRLDVELSARRVGDAFARIRDLANVCQLPACYASGNGSLRAR